VLTFPQPDLALMAFRNAQKCKIKMQQEENKELILDQGTLEILLEMAGRLALPEVAAEIMQLLKHEEITIRDHHYACLIQSFFGKKDFTSAFTVMRLMRKAGYDPQAAVTSLTSRLCVSPNEFPGDEPSSSSESLGMTKRKPPKYPSPPIANEEDWKRAHHALRASKSTTGDLACFNLLLEAADYLGLTELGIKLYQEIESFQFVPNLTTIHHALCCARHDTPMHSKILSYMHSQQIEPTAVTYHILLKQTVDKHMASDPSQATATAQQVWNVWDCAVQEKKINQDLYLCMLRFLVSIKDARWQQIWQDMVALGYYVNLRTYEWIANKYQGDPVLDQFPNPSVSIRAAQEGTPAGGYFTRIGLYGKVIHS
jgi:pentatricopeptide repeat protein